MDATILISLRLERFTMSLQIPQELFKQNLDGLRQGKLICLQQKTCQSQIVKSESTECSKIDDTLYNEVLNWYKVENLSSNKDVTKSETNKRASDILDSSAEFKEGRYHVGLLWKNKPDLPNNFTLAFKKLNALVKRLEMDQNPNDTKESTILPPTPIFGKKDEQPSSTDTERVLGIQWSVSRDSFVINSKTFKKVDLENPTKRRILKSVSSIYDLIGFIAPFTMRLETIMQDVWRLGKQWDNPLPNSFDATLNSLMTEIRNLSSIEIPRFLFGEKKTPKESTLHIFRDASLTAMSAVEYLKTEYTYSTCSINFIMGKAKVAPIRQQNIPKLELAAAVIGVRLAFFIKQQLDVTISKTTIWSDSATTLQWIYNSKERHKMYVANRVAKNLETTSTSDWRHVPCVLNPADNGTRGLKLNEFNPECRGLTGHFS